MRARACVLAPRHAYAHTVWSGGQARAAAAAGARRLHLAASSSSSSPPPRSVRRSSAVREPAAHALGGSWARSGNDGNGSWAGGRPRAYGVYRTIEQLRARHQSGPFSWKAGLLFVLSGITMIVYFQREKSRLRRQRIADATKGIGKPKVGGPFALRDHDGAGFSSEQMKGRYALVYFGFSHCPDICPDELDKMARMVDLVRAARGDVMRPLFVTCDPARDSPAVLKAYLAEFHPALVGLTGSWDEIKAMCKAYRVYFSTPPEVKPGQDYLVDHSIYFYLMDPDGDFVECIGRQHTAEEGAKLITDHIGDWKGAFR
ncbi:MAG: Cu-binding protein [Phylliscum demangeonii]|nr:MAG: Cu-binding protein [Phylliscum demangeonii]